MQPGSSRPAQAGIPVIVADIAWRRAVRRVEAVCSRAAIAAGGASCILLTSDHEVKRLNARHRGRNKPTNVLTFENYGGGGDIVLASGTVVREARAAGRPVAHHLTHLVVHGALHLQGLMHDAPGDARRMEMAEAQILHWLMIPNPWRNA